MYFINGYTVSALELGDALLQRNVQACENTINISIYYLGGRASG